MWGKKALTNAVNLLGRYNLLGIVSNLSSNIKNKLERKISEKGAVRAGKGFILFVSDEDMNDFIKITKSLEDSGALIDGVTETIKHEIKKQEDGFLKAISARSAASLVEPVVSLIVKGISGIRIIGSWRGYTDKNF